MTTTPTAALIEEAEKMAVRALDGTASREEKSALFASLAAALRRAEAERDEVAEFARKIGRERDVQVAAWQKTANDLYMGNPPTEPSMSAGLRLMQAHMQQRDELKAQNAKLQQERDAQHAEVLRLTGEAQRVRKESLERARTVLMLDEDLDEARAQVWGLICAGSNMAKAKRYYQGLWETLLDAGLKTDRKVSELTATRDLLTKKNARLQARVATLELLLRCGK